VFAAHVLANCGSQCVFCGFRPAPAVAKRMLLAGHIKPWKDSTPAGRLGPRNGLAACPAHDVAFDTGLLTVNGGLRIHAAHSLAGAVQSDPLARQYYGRSPLRETLVLPAGAQPPARRYLDWHRQQVFTALPVPALIRRDDELWRAGSTSTTTRLLRRRTVTSHRSTSLSPMRLETYC
jgi:putative restriction endonuclease